MRPVSSTLVRDTKKGVSTVPGCVATPLGIKGCLKKNPPWCRVFVVHRAPPDIQCQGRRSVAMLPAVLSLAPCRLPQRFPAMRRHARQRVFFSRYLGACRRRTPGTPCRSEGTPKTRLAETFPTPPFDSAFSLGVRRRHAPKSCQRWISDCYARIRRTT